MIETFLPIFGEIERHAENAEKLSENEPVHFMVLSHKYAQIRYTLHTDAVRIAVFRHFGRNNRKTDTKYAPRLACLFQPDITAHEFRQHTADRQAEPRPAKPAVTGPFILLEAFEYPLARRFIDPAARVFDPDHQKLRAGHIRLRSRNH